MKSIAIVLLTLHTLGSILLPGGDFSYMRSLPQMYQHCKAEDDDLDVKDFVVEHLLNLEDVLQFFEAGSEKEKNDKPHQPYQHVASMQSPVIVARVFNFAIKATSYTGMVKQTYPIRNEPELPSAFLSQIFRPPIA